MFLFLLFRVVGERRAQMGSYYLGAEEASAGMIRGQSFSRSPSEVKMKDRRTKQVREARSSGRRCRSPQPRLLSSSLLFSSLLFPFSSSLSSKASLFSQARRMETQCSIPPKSRYKRFILMNHYPECHSQKFQLYHLRAQANQNHEPSAAFAFSSSQLLLPQVKGFAKAKNLIGV